MTILGIFIKQPVEVEVYGIQFAEDMADTDQVSTAWQMIARTSTAAWDGVIQTSAYTVLTTDDDRQLVTTEGITLPTGVADGFRVNVANMSQIGGVGVGSFNVPARGALILVRENGAWKEEASTTSVLVDAVADQRVRTRVVGGTPFEEYRVEVTVTTSEGRTMQNEFIVQIEES